MGDSAAGGRRGGDHGAVDEPWWVAGAPAAVSQTYAAARAGNPTAMVRIGGCAAGLGEIDDGLRWFDAARRAGDPTAVQLVESLSEVRAVDRAVDRPRA